MMVQMMILLVFLHLSLVVDGAFVDLTHEFEPNKTIYWPTSQSYNITMEIRGMSDAGFWYETEDIAASTHGGTHLDAPAHFAKGKWHVEQIPLSHLIGPAVIVDIREQASQNRDHQLSVRDITAWENEHGPIPHNAIVIMNSGWSKFWPDKLAYLGTDSGQVSQLHFPGLAPETAQWLVKHRKILGFGVDTPSVDYGQSKDFKSHQIFGEEDIFLLENVKIPEDMPQNGATVMAMPMKIKRGSGAPCRIVAFWGEDSPLSVNSTPTGGRMGLDVFVLTVSFTVLMLYRFQ